MIRKSLFALIILFLFGCTLYGNATKDFSKPTKNSNFQVYTRILVTKAEYNSTWPFSVDSGFIECIALKDNGHTWIFTTSNGKSYHIAGGYMNVMSQILHDDIDEIWLKSPHDEDARVSMTLVSMKALEFCGP